MVKKLGLGVLVLVALAAAGLAGWYQVDGQPLPEARQYLAGEGYVAEEEDNGSPLFTPSLPNGHGLLIMHGALIKPMIATRRPRPGSRSAATPCSCRAGRRGCQSMRLMMPSRGWAACPSTIG